MKLVVDENIVLGKEAFGALGEIIFLNGREITNQILLDADILIVRSITKVDRELLKNTKVKFVGTATIGTDHIDQSYLEENNIQFSSAAGCNSYSVAEYVLSAIAHIANKHNFDLAKKSIGVIGYGNIGTKVVKIANSIGMKVVINDPPVKRKTNKNSFSSLNEALKCDIITFHVPLNKDGIDKTVHLLNENNIGLIREKAILINTSRGPVVSNDVLKERLKEKKNIYTVIDVWETEPNFSSELFGLTEIGTPHIAGYSLEGKINGTKIIYDALLNYLKIPKTWKPIFDKVVDNKIEIYENENYSKVFLKLFNKSYKIMEDDLLMRKSDNLVAEERGKYFDFLRKNYRKRRELSNFEAILKLDNKDLKKVLKTLRVKF